MKKFFAVFIAVFMAISLFSCGGKSDESDKNLSVAVNETVQLIEKNLEKAESVDTDTPV